MASSARPLAKLIEELPPELQGQVRALVESLLAKRKRGRGKVLRQDWAGALREYRDQFSALALQKKALEWRGD